MKVVSTTPIKSGDPSSNITLVKMNNGLANAYIFYYPQGYPRVRLFLSSTGIAPSFLVNINGVSTVAFNIPKSQQACQVEYDFDIKIPDVQVYKKDTKPSVG
jgi:hypothetical protein